jgi:hypothetical protein
MTYPFSFLITIADFMKISKKISAYIKVTLISLFKFTKHLNAAFKNDKIVKLLEISHLTEDIFILN